MRIPSKNTCSYAICKIIYANGAKADGDIMRELKDRFVRQTMLDKIAEMLDSGMLVRSAAGLNIATPISRYFEQCEAAPARAPAGVMATTRVAQEFKPLRGYKLPVDGAREGADDHRKYASRHF